MSTEKRQPADGGEEWEDGAQVTSPPTPQMSHSEPFADMDEEPDSGGAPAISDLQARAIELTVQGLSDVRIAEILSIGRRTLARWKTTDFVYKRALKEARVQTHAAAADRVQQLLFKATAVLAKHLDEPDKDTQFRAAHVLLTMGGRYAPRLAGKWEEAAMMYPPEPRLGPKVG